MVRDLFATPGAGQDSEIFAFASDVDADQRMEIDRMSTHVEGVSEMKSGAIRLLCGSAAILCLTIAGGAQQQDPRVGLKAGLRDAGQAARHMELVASLPKPEGFFDPTQPAGDPTPAGDAGCTGQLSVESTVAADTTVTGLRRRHGRRLSLNFANSDLAFSGTLVFIGNFNGFNTYDIETPKKPQLFASVVCPGGQGDVSVYGHLLFMSVEQTRGRIDCGTQGSHRHRQRRTLPRRSHFRYQRRQEAKADRRGADLPRIAHPHAGRRSEGSGKFYIYGSGTSTVRSGDELAGCSRPIPKTIRTRRSSASTSSRFRSPLPTRRAS